MSHTSFAGRVAQSPELKFGKTGKPYLSLNVAENHRGKNQQGEYEDTGTSWRRVTVFGAHAENTAEQVQKGSLVIGYGREETREYTKQNGETGSSRELIADELGVLIPKWAPKGTQNQQQSQGWGSNQPQPDPWGSQPAQGGGWDAPRDEPSF